MQDGETPPYNVTVDWNLLDRYMKRLDEVKERYSIESNISLGTITEIPDLFIVEQNEDILLQIKELMMASVEEAARSEERRVGKEWRRRGCAREHRTTRDGEW